MNEPALPAIEELRRENQALKAALLQTVEMVDHLYSVVEELAARDGFEDRVALSALIAKLKQ